MDADICFLGPIPEPPPEPYQVALAPHMIRNHDEALYGKYNGGYAWFRTHAAVNAWRGACATSRFFEQAALEVFDTEPWSATLFTFPKQVNYGWWRMWQAKESPQAAIQEWGLFRNAPGAGLQVGGKPLLSVHTHWHRAGISEEAVSNFNMVVIGWLQKISAMHPPAKKMLDILKLATAA